MSLRKAVRYPFGVLRRKCQAALLLDARARSRMTRRSNLPSTSSVQYRQVGALELEAYLLRVHDQNGVGLSAYIGIEEIMRFDCFGPTGHFHLNLQQAHWASSTNVQRLSFCSADMAGQIDETIYRLNADLLSALRSNWRPEIRATPVSADDVAAAVAWSADRLRHLSTFVHSDSQDSTDAG